MSDAMAGSSPRLLARKAASAHTPYYFGLERLFW